MKRLFIFAILIVLTITNLNAELHFKQYRSTDGLPNNTVRAILQDSHNFIWLATLNGLVRFDGSSFSTFQPDSKAAVSLSDNRIYTLTEDHDNYLWIGTTARIYSCFDLQKGRFVSYSDNNTDPYSRILVTTNGDVWLWHNKFGACRVRHGKNRTLSSKRFDKASGLLPDDEINCIAEVDNHTIVIGTQKGLSIVQDERVSSVNTNVNVYAVDRLNTSVYITTVSGEIFRLDNNILTPLATLPKAASPTSTLVVNNTLIIFTTLGVWRLNPLTDKLSKDDNLDIKNGNITYDNFNRPWIYNHTGNLTFYSENDKRFKTLNLIPSSIINLIDHERFHVIEDTNGLIWISTYGNGLFSYNQTNGETIHYDAYEDSNSPINSNYIRYMMLDSSGGLWVATEYSGVTRIWNTNEKVEYIYPDKSNQFTRANAVRMLTSVSPNELFVASKTSKLYKWGLNKPTMEYVTELSSNIYCTIKMNDNVYWYGTRGHGLFIDNINYRHVTNDSTSLPNDNIYFIYRDIRDRIWIGTFGGGCAMAEALPDNRLKFRSFVNDTHGLNEHRCIVEDNDGRFWIGTSGGIVTFHPDSILFDPNRYRVYSRTKNSFSSNEIRHLYRDSADNLWIATGDMGLVCATTSSNGDLKVQKAYTTHEGLSNNSVQSIIEDDKNNLWIGTEYGLSNLLHDSEHIENYIFSKNVLENVYSENCIYKSPDGEIIIGTNCGIIKIRPEDFVFQSDSLSPLRFTNLKINGEIISSNDNDSPLEKSIDYSKRINLKYYQNSISIDFLILDFRPDDNYRYSYILEGYDHDWSVPSSVGNASYKYLPSGKYVLKVKCLVGNKCVEENSIDIIVSDPWWTSPVAKIIYVIFFILILYLAYRLFIRFNYLRNRIFIEKEITEYKLKFFTNISHEFRTPLTLIAGALERLRDMNNLPVEVEKPLKIMEKNSSRMLRLVNQLMEFRKSENNSLKLSVEPLDIVHFTKNLSEGFQNDAEQRGLTLNFLSDFDEIEILADKNYIDKIEYNLISNALKYTPQGGTVNVSVSKEGSEILIIVSDSGIGIDTNKRMKLFSPYFQSAMSHESMGIGLALSRDLACKHHGNLSYSPNPNGGSIFTLRLPLDSSIYTPDERFIFTSLVKDEKVSTQPFSSDLDSNNKDVILIIEDNIELRAFIREEIEQKYKVIVASDGIEGLKIARESDVDLIVSDVMMPNMDGLELTKQIKSDISTSHIPIILLTALADNDNILTGLNSGADDYVVKPFSSKILVARIKRILERREILRKKFSSEPQLTTSDICTSSPDRDFVERLENIALSNLSNAEFSMDDFASELNVGRAVFYRKLRAILGISPNDYLKKLRLKIAADLLRSKPNLTMAEIADKIGFSDSFYFSKCFKAEYGISPSEYRKKKD